MSSPSTASPALTLSRYRKKEGKDGHPVRFWATSSPHLATPRHRLTSSDRAAPRRSAILPTSLSSSPSGGEGMEASQLERGDPLQLTPSTLSTLPGRAAEYCGHLRKHSGGRSAIAGRRGCSARKFVSGNFARLYRSKYQLFNFSEGNNRAKASAVGDCNCT